MTERDQTLTVLPGTYAIARLPPGAAVVEIPRKEAFFSVTRTPSEVSIVCEEGQAPSRAEVRRGYACLEVEGPLELSEVGILASLSGALAEAGIPLFALSTHDTDYLLVERARLVEAAAALERAGHRVRQPGS